MRLESAGPRTWLLAAVAGWAVLAVLLAVAGMGGRVAPLVGGVAAAALPSVPVGDDDATAAPLARFAEIGKRPLFSSDRKPKPFTLQGDDDGEADDKAFDYVLTSVLITPGLKMAILLPGEGSDPVRVKLNAAPEAHPGWRLVELEKRSAVFEGPEGRRTLPLRVFDGHGGEAPTAVATPRRAGEADAARSAGALPEPPPAPAKPSKPAVADAGNDDAEPAKGESKPATPEAQMEAIRKRIQARRAALREQAQNQQKGQTQNPPQNPTPQPPDPPSGRSPNQPAESR